MKLLNSILEKAKQKKIALICLAISVVCLAFGLLPYLFVRTSGTYISLFFDLFFDFEKIPLNKNGFFYQVITQFFSDCCWAFAMPFFLFAFTGGRLPKKFYFLTMPIIGSVLEVFQFLGIIDGVGDVIDVLIYFIGSILGFIVIERGLLKCQTKQKNQAVKKI